MAAVSSSRRVHVSSIGLTACIEPPLHASQQHIHPAVWPAGGWQCGGQGMCMLHTHAAPRASAVCCHGGPTVAPAKVPTSTNNGDAWPNALLQEGLSHHRGCHSDAQLLTAPHDPHAVSASCIPPARLLTVPAHILAGGVPTSKRSTYVRQHSGPHVTCVLLCCECTVYVKRCRRPAGLVAIRGARC